MLQAVARECDDNCLFFLRVSRSVFSLYKVNFVFLSHTECANSHYTQILLSGCSLSRRMTLTLPTMKTKNNHFNEHANKQNSDCLMRRSHIDAPTTNTQPEDIERFDCFSGKKKSRKRPILRLTRPIHHLGSIAGRTDKANRCLSFFLTGCRPSTFCRSNSIDVSRIASLFVAWAYLPTHQR